MDISVDSGNKNMVILTLNGYRSVCSKITEIENYPKQAEYFEEMINNLDINAEDYESKKSKYQEAAFSYRTKYSNNEYKLSDLNAYQKKVEEIGEGNLLVFINVPAPLEFKIWTDLHYIPAGKFEAQTQSVTGDATRWWETTEINWDELVDEESGRIKIVKEVENDEYIEDGTKFNFKVTVNGALNDGEEILTLDYKKDAEENAVYSKVYNWKKATGKNKTTPPTYTVEEITDDLDGKEFEKDKVTITNASGSLISQEKVTEATKHNESATKTVTVHVTNKLRENNSNLKISKEILTKLAGTENLKGKSYKFEIGITGPCEFEYVSYNENGDQTKGKLTVKENETKTIETYIEGKRVTQRNTSEEYITVIPNIKWYGKNEPKYTIKEILETECTESKPETYYKEGYFKDKDEIKVKFINEENYNKGKIEIIKELDNQNYFSEEDLKDFKFKFKIKVFSSDGTTPLKDPMGHEYKEEKGYATCEASKDGTKYVWKVSSQEYIWPEGSDAWYTIEEDDTWCPKHGEGCEKGSCPYIKSIRFFTRAEGIDDKFKIIDNVCKGKLYNENVVHEFDAKIVNEAVCSEKGTIQINKNLVGNEPNLVKDYYFSVILKGIFKINNTPYSGMVRISTDTDGNIKYTPINEETDEPDKFVIITPENLEKGGVWKLPDTIEWAGDAPGIKIEENLAGANVTTSDGVMKEIHVSGLPNGYKNLSDNEGNLEENGVTTYSVTAVNSIDPSEKSARLCIIKTLKNSEFCTTKFISERRFEFKITIGDHIEYVTLGDKYHPAIYDEENDEYSWTYTTGDYIFKENVNEVKYEVEEVETNHQKIEKAEKEEGTLKPGDIAVINIKELGIENEIKEDSGSLEIQKYLTDANNNNQNMGYKFKVNITGSFEYKGTAYKNTTLEIPVQVEPNKTEKIDLSWYGEAPKYSITEVKDEENQTSQLTFENDEGVFEGEGRTVYAKCINTANEQTGNLTVRKRIDAKGDYDKNQLFSFKVTIGNEVQYIKIKADEAWTSNTITWKCGEEEPTYKVEEYDIPRGYELKEITNSTGKLKAGETISVTATNKADKNETTLEIKKDVVFNKLMNNLADQEFTVNLVLCSTAPFTYEGREIEVTEQKVPKELVNSENLINDSITDENSGRDLQKLAIVTEEIKIKRQTDAKNIINKKVSWNGDIAPSVVVSEKQMEKWETPIYSNNADTGFVLSNKDKNSITITNRIQVEVELTMRLAGVVWEDIALDPTGKNTADSKENGIYDKDKEKGIGGVLVNVYRVVLKNGEIISSNLATVKKDVFNSNSTLPTVTASDGSWVVSGLEVPVLSDSEKALGATSVKYDVEFIYDGQTYEPTKVLAEPKSYLADPYQNNGEYFKTSFALDADRQDVDNRISEIYGKTSIDGAGNTIGTVSGKDGKETNIKYEAEVPATSGRVKSVLQTTDKKTRIAFDLFKARAKTSTAGFVFPSSNTLRLGFISTDYTVDTINKGIKQSYRAVYEESLHINLGLKARRTVDIDSSKDLISAKLVVDGKEIDYTFNSLADYLNIEKNNLICKSLTSDKKNISYELGLYKTDYYYRAEIYKSNKVVYEKVQSFYKSLGMDLESSELELYLTYRINVYNTSESDDYVVEIKEINDYFDSSFGEPVSEEISRMVYDENSKSKVIAVPSYIENGHVPVEWKVKEKNIKGSDGGRYNKMTATLSENNRIRSGENINIYVTFAIQKETIDEIEDCIALGNKSNIVEISKYSTYYKNGTIAGKIDKDSAPDNINIANHNDEKRWYEDDADAAPVLNLTLIDEHRNINGTAWEDEPGDNAQGDGIRQLEEKSIGGLTTELVEKIKVPGEDGKEQEYDFLWPTSESLDSLGGKSLKELTGFSTTTETSREKGTYSFNRIPSGTYVVRFRYGNNKIEQEDITDLTLKSPEAINRVYDFCRVANYDGDKQGKTQVIYNGQDYKSTIYQANKGTLTDEYYDLNREDIRRECLSDAKDDEARRLDVIANSETITNKNSEVLASANNLEADHNDLFRDYEMFADTARIDLTFESEEPDEDGTYKLGIDTSEETDEKIHSPAVQINKTTTEYTVPDVDFGLIERPENRTILDKQIKEIKLTTNDNKLIFDARYKISYNTVEASGTENIKGTIIGVIEKNPGTGFEYTYLVAEVELDTANSIGIDLMQSINKNENKLEFLKENDGTKNFRFINIDNEIMQGMTVEIKYQLAAINLSDPDYVSDKLNEIINVENGENSSINIKKQLKDKAEEIREKITNCSYEFGQVLGEYYYNGNLVDGLVPVQTKIRQLVDYVDNDAEFIQEQNNINNGYWRNTSIQELSGSGYENERIVSKEVIPQNRLIDKDGVDYVIERRNNLILSNDIQTVPSNDYISNADFEKFLTPYNIDSEESISTIELTVSKAMSGQNDSNNLTYDNLAEIVKFENTAGRRDVTTVAGNANPKLDAFTAALEERDSSATELVTFTPPTGIEMIKTMKLQILIISTIALSSIVIGIVIIKKKVLK